MADKKAGKPRVRGTRTPESAARMLPRYRPFPRRGRGVPFPLVAYGPVASCQVTPRPEKQAAACQPPAPLPREALWRFRFFRAVFTAFVFLGVVCLLMYWGGVFQQRLGL